MGVKGLLPAVAVQAESVDVYATTRGAAVAIDAFGWAHAMAMHKYESLVVVGEPGPLVAALMELAVRYVNNGCKPVFVFDGRRLPAKSGTDAERQRKWAVAQALVNSALQNVADLAELKDKLDSGEPLGLDVDDKTLRAALAIDDAVVTAWIRELRKGGFTVFKAPYEADAQLALLCQLGMVQYVETVDSDLLVYGCKKVLMKVNHGTGKAQLFTLARWTEETAENKNVPLLALCRKWGTGVLPFFAVLAGCDVVKFAGFGPQTAQAILGTLTKGRAATSEITVRRIVDATQRLIRTKKLRTVNQLPPDFEAKLLFGLEVFQKQVVYHPLQKRDMPLDLASESPAVGSRVRAPPAHCGSLCSTAPVTVQVGEDGDADGVDGFDAATPDAVSLPRCEAHAQGFIASRGGSETLVMLPPLTQVVRGGTAAPDRLTVDMVQGAELDPRLVTDAAIRAGPRARNAVGIQRLKQFLMTRGQVGLSKGDWKVLAQKAQDILALEKDEADRAIARGEEPPVPPLRDNTGGCTVGYLMERGIVTVAQFPQGDGALTAPDRDDPGWVTDLALISNSAPGISEPTLLEHFRELGAMEDDHIRVLERGYCHIEGVSKLAYFGYHALPIPARPEVAAFRMLMRASFAAHYYSVTVLVQVDLDAARTIKPIVKVLHVLCGPAKVGGDLCRASAASHNVHYACCTHGSACLQVIRNLPRADNVDVPTALVSRTSKLQAWSNPGQGVTEDLSRPVRSRLASVLSGVLVS